MTSCIGFFNKQESSFIISYSCVTVLLSFDFFFLCFQGVQQKRPSAAQNAILRRYFLELTQSFIIPLVIHSEFFILSLKFFKMFHSDLVL